MTALALLNDDLDDSLDDFLGDFGLERRAPGVEPKAPLPTELFTEPCKKCRGTGRFVGYTGRLMGQCFACKGKGSLSFKTSPENRQAQREARADKKGAAMKAWVEAHDAEFKWMVAATGRGFHFASEMLTAVGKYGSLTERQLAAVQRCLAQDAEREERRAREAKEREANAIAVDITRIVGSMLQAMDKGIQYPVLRLDGFRFTIKAGTLYVRDADNRDRYLGKIENGKFVRSRDCTPDEEARIVEAAHDPMAAARIYGKRTGSCSCCGRELTNHESIELGIGPICASKFF